MVDLNKTKILLNFSGFIGRKIVCHLKADYTLLIPTHMEIIPTVNTHKNGVSPTISHPLDDMYLFLERDNTKTMLIQCTGLVNTL